MKRLMRWLQLPGIGLLAVLAASGCKKVAPEGEITPSQNYFQVSSFAGSGGNVGGFGDGTGNLTAFSTIAGITTDPAGNLYVTDQNNFRIRKITPTGVVSTFAGNGVNGYVDGIGTGAQFSYLQGITIDAAGNLYAVDYGNNVIRKITPAGIVSTYAGTGQPGLVDGPVATAKFSLPTAITIDKAGNLFVADGSYVVRKISADGIVSTYAGVPNTSARNPPAYEGPANQLKFGLYINGLTTDAAGNLYVADQLNNFIYKISTDGHASVWAGDGLVLGLPNLTYKDGFGPTAEFTNPIGLSSDASGNIYVAEQFGNRIRKITKDRVVSTVTGDGKNGEATGVGTIAQVNTPSAITNNTDGSIIYFTEINRIGKIESITSAAKLPQNSWNNPQSWGNPR